MLLCIIWQAWHASFCCGTQLCLLTALFLMMECLDEVEMKLPMDGMGERGRGE
ncbi:hypothetical protein TRIATDRAFT_256070 [Trichoderma atroviride IMI 206040]|uniref:Uncharacterized protein n=1 Tax=Hypocrea atroviridis (strain ATCC 20476 / IMI 206040) TaxID=452589 RepID=G9NNZ3_HYPAI|nr:uncharacterized protein TRIATDRAFT_256070 [Trichoderma atroviride IMI 206040]EHK47781.1 hypothetical protein TRIATDRAFT_256070 [Trichoderma atroviride IMI 206040]